MRVVADTQAIYWYLTAPDRLSVAALRALDEAEDTDGIVVSSWTVPELWMTSTRKRGARATPRSSYEQVRTVLLDPESAVDVEPFDAPMWPHFEVASMALADPFDSAIVATARTLGLDLVTSDREIQAASLVTVIW